MSPLSDKACDIGIFLNRHATSGPPPPFNGHRCHLHLTQTGLSTKDKAQNIRINTLRKANI